jgi:ATP-dependent protease ClpP protease subunit
MVINLNGEINSDLLDKAIHSFNQLKDGEKLDIFLCSPGGDIYTMEAIIAFLSLNADRINLYGYGDLSSAAFIIFFRANCPKALLPGTTGMAHLVRLTGTFVGDIVNWKDKSESKFNVEWTKQLKKEFITFLDTLGLTEDELTKVKKGEDVFFLYKRMDQLLRNQLNNAEHD